ncbi:MAG: type II toxin-antitoxin system HipA family toxin [Alphaproteobacteria bacterium]|nr:type II toxin-antitoxin system HipA family toxin [Alphaproteobacteria bacterium]
MKYQPLNLLNVFLDFPTKQKVGRLAQVNGRVYFEYEQHFLSSKLELSPFKLPLKPGVIQCNEMLFEGLFGVFNDSLPDGWGRLLLDRHVRTHGIAPELLTPLDRLTHVGPFGMGAFIYEPDVWEKTVHSDVIHLDKLATESQEVLEGESEDVFTELLELSGSSAGARPKVMVGVDENKKRIIYGQQHLKKNYDHWMVKFSSSHDMKDMGAIEYAYSLMAKAASIEMMDTHLFPSKKGTGYFGVMRFDRDKEKRKHMHTISGLLHADHRLPSIDYEHIMRATQQLTHNIKEVEKILSLCAFNVFAHNRDDHAKNFSFLMDDQGRWTVSPAYDLTFSSGPGGEHSTTVMGEGRSPGKKHLLKLGEKFGVSQIFINHIIDEVQCAVNKWPLFADEAGVRKTSSKLIANVIMGKR